MGLILKNVRINKAGRYEFRQGVPERLRGIVGTREIKKVIGATEAQAVSAYPRVRAEADKLLAEARKALKAGAKGPAARQTQLDAWREAKARFREFVPEDMEDDPSYLIAVADSLLRPYREAPDKVPEVTRHLVNLVRGHEDTPLSTLADAKALYRREKIGSGDEAKKTEQRLDRVFGRVEKALGHLPALSELTYEHACTVRDHMLKIDGLKPESVKRELNFVRAAIGLYAKAHPKETVINPFRGLEMGSAVTGVADDGEEKRKSLPEPILSEVRARIIARASDDLRLIWRLLEGTGCRLAEVTGLRLEDVEAAGELPHIVVTWHEDRRIKTRSSRRRVPLVGDALAAAKEARERAGNGPMLFASYGKANGPTNASAALMKYVRAASKKPEHVVHSLRHNMKDWLVDADVDETTQNLILGHHLGSVGNRYYLGDAAKLRAAMRAMEKAFGVEPSSEGTGIEGDS